MVSTFLLKKPVIWTFSVFSPIESLSTESSLSLAILKTFKIFSRERTEFFQKNSVAERFENFRLSAANYSNSVILRNFNKNQDFFRKTYIFSEKTPKSGRFQNFHSSSRIQQRIWYFQKFWEFWKQYFKKSVIFLGKPQFLNILRNLSISIAFYRKIDNFSNFKKINSFFQKTSIFSEKTQFLNVLPKFTLSVALSSKFATFSNSTKIQDFFWERYLLFFFKKTSHMNVFSFFTNWVAFYGKFALFSDFKNIQDFFQKTYRVFFKKTQFLNVLRIFGLSVANYSKLLFQGILKKIKTFFEKLFFSEKTLKSGRFQNFHSSSRIRQRIWYFQNFKIIDSCFSKKP